MNDYKEPIADLRHYFYDAEIVLDAADAVEQLVKERDAAVADLTSVIADECGLNQCYYCKYREEDGQCHHDCIPYSEKCGWEWRGVREDMGVYRAEVCWR